MITTASVVEGLCDADRGKGGRGEAAIGIVVLCVPDRGTGGRQHCDQDHSVMEVLYDADRIRVDVSTVIRTTQ